MTQIIFPVSVLSSAAKAAAIEARHAERELGMVRKVRGLTRTEHQQVLKVRQLANRLARKANHG